VLLNLFDVAAHFSPRFWFWAHFTKNLFQNSWLRVIIALSRNISRPTWRRFAAQRLRSTRLAQLCCKCCSLTVSVVVNVWFTTNGICMKNNSHVARINRNKMSTTWFLYCCLVPQCEALRTGCSAFPITTKWCFDQVVKVVLGTNFIRRTCYSCGSSQKRGDVAAISRLALHRKQWRT